MARRNRQTLKKSFRKGEKPTEKDFENLIDSTLNILDDGFSRSAEAGLELAPLLGEKRVVLSVYREPGDARPQWELSVGGAGELKISKAGIADSSQLLVLNPDGSVVLGERESKITLAGVMETPGRSGTFSSGSVPADGKWHDLTEWLEGVYALEVVAAAGRRNSGKHALLVATATNCFGARSRIRYTRSHYGLSVHRLSLRWIKEGLKARLQIKTLFNYDHGIAIHYHISSLWDNPLMENI